MLLTNSAEELFFMLPDIEELRVILAQRPPYSSQRSFGSGALDWCWVAAANSKREAGGISDTHLDFNPLKFLIFLRPCITQGYPFRTPRQPPSSEPVS